MVASSAVAINPKTGQPIKILTLEPSLWRNAKTLVWFNERDASSIDPRTLQSYSRWDVAAENLAAWRALRTAGLQADVVLCLNDSVAEVRDWFASSNWSTARLVIVPKSTIEAITFEVFASFRVTNVLCVDEVKDLYPYAGPAWDGTLEDAKAIVALLLRAHLTFPLQSEATQRADLMKARGLKTEAGGSADSARRQPPALWFITQYYNAEKGRRRKEISSCLEQNLANPFVDRVILLNETAGTVPTKYATDPKLTEEIIGKRLTYADVLRWVRQSGASPETIIVFANADIFLGTGETWRALWSVDLERKFLALLRWDVDGTDQAARNAAKLFGPRPDSQDTWILRAGTAQEMKVDDWAPLEIPFGKAGCDNAITYEMMRRRCLVCNPALTLQTYHYHTSQVRSYDPRDIVDRPVYVYLTPTGIHDMEPVYDLKAAASSTETVAGDAGAGAAAFPRRIEGPLSEAQARTFCTMIQRNTEGAVDLQHDGDNLWTPPATTLYRMRDVFQTREGLPFGHNAIYVGRAKASTEAWSKSELSSLSASIGVDFGLIAPLPEPVAKDPGRYVLEYISKILLLREKVSGGEFWCPKAPPFGTALRAFKWGPTKEIPVLSRDDTAQAWCREALVMLPEDRPTSDFCTPAEIGALRAAFGVGGGWEAEVEESKRLIVVVDGKWITDEVAEGLERGLEGALESRGIGLRVKVLWEGSTSLDTALFAIKGAWGIVTAGSSSFAAWSWVLPRSARVWDVQSEMEPSARLLHIAGAAGLKCRLTIVPKGGAQKGVLIEKLLKDIVPQIGEGAGPAAAPAAAPATPPLLILPAADRKDFFSHVGDSFRELARLWAEKGYVRIQESPTATQVWLGSIGDTLLYDRPTLEWLAAAPDSEKKWRRALFGNPVPASALGLHSPQPSPWIFWPRRPRLVEDAVAAGIGAASYQDRARGLVFYGRSENAVQLQRRIAADWATAATGPADEFVHLKGASSPYPFTQMEYLRRLAGARFGLCLAGYGRKCHREIECMAMGCVPIAAPDVDMSSYADPPLEGVHYLRVSGPEEAARLVAETTPEKWAEMSAAGRDWWRRNASVEGAWKMTLAAAAAAVASE